MSNPFDQFDQQPAANPFDQFTAPSGMGDHVDSYLADKPGLADDIKGLLQKRVDAVTNAPDLPNFMISSARLGVGGAADIGGAALSAIPGAGLVKSATGAIGGGIAHAIGSIPTADSGTTFGDVGNAFTGMVQREEAANPTLANAAGYAQDVGNLAAEKGIVNLGRAGINAASDAAFNAKPPMPTSAQGFAEAAKAYQALDQSGTTITAQAVNGFLKDAAKGVITDPKVSGAVGKSEATKYLTTGGDSGEGLMSLANEPITIQQVHAIDKDLSQQISGHFSNGLDTAGKQLMDLQDTFREHFMTPDAANVTGGADGLDAWQQANDLYHKASKMEAVENVVADAKNTANPAQAIQTGLKNILKSAKKTRGYTDDELSALQDGAKTGFAEDALRTFGGRLMTGVGTGVGTAIGAGIGGPIGAGVGAMIGGGTSFLGGKMLRGSAAAIQEQGANKLLNTMAEGGLKFKPPSLTSPIKPPPMLQLTNQQADTAAQRYAASLRSNEIGPARTAFGPDASTTGVNLQGVPYNTGAMGEPLALPSPQSLSKTELATNSQGQNAWRTNAEQAGVNASRENDTATGMSQSVRQAIVKNAMSAKFGPAWDSIQSSEKSKILDQMDQMWDGKSPQSLQSMIDVAHQNLQDINAAKGSSIGINNFGEALRNALKVNFRSAPPSLTTIISK